MAFGGCLRKEDLVSSSAVDVGNIIAAEYFVDTDPGVGSGNALSVGANGAVVNFTASIPTSVTTGFHFSIRVKNADGNGGCLKKEDSMSRHQR
jgi:hypothetical protein